MPTPAQHRITQIWSWLPAFRAVAEFQHVHRAAAALHVTPSALSRSIGLLEAQLELKLFDRIGRNLHLNREGETFLASVRDAMRRVDEGLREVTGTTFRGELRVACAGDQPIAFASRAAAVLRSTYPELVTTVEQAPTGRELPARLLRGELDVALVTSAPVDERLSVELLSEVAYGVYAGISHPLFSRRKTPLALICQYPFVAPTPGLEQGADDFWPHSIARTIALYLPALQPAIAACETGRFLAALPVTAVVDAISRGSLRLLPCEVAMHSELYSVRRKSAGAPGRAEAFIDAAKAQLGLSLRTRRRQPARRR